MLVLAVVAGLVALSQRGEARRTALGADAQRLGAEALLDDRLDHGLLLARAGVELEDSIPTRSSLLAALLRNPAALSVMRGDGHRFLSAALSPDGATLAVGDNGSRVTFFDAASRRPLEPPYQLPEGSIFEVGYSPDGSLLSVAGGRDDGSFVDVVDARTHKLVAHMPPGPPEKPNLPYNASARFAGDGDSLIIAYAVDGPPGIELPPAILTRTNARTGAPIARPVRIGSPAPTAILMTTADRKRLFLSSEADKATLELDAETLHIVRRYEFGGFTPAISDDGRLLALGAEDGSVRVIELASGNERKLTGRHEAPVQRALFAPDHRTLVTTGDDGKVIVWDLRRDEIRETLTGHTGRVLGAAISSDSRTLFTAALDSTVIAWDLSGERRLGRPFAGGAANPGPEQFAPPLAVSKDGRALVLGQPDGWIHVRDPKSLRHTARFRANADGFVAGVAVSPNSRTVAAIGAGREPTLWDARTRQRIGNLHGLRAPGLAIDFTPDGKLLAAADIEGNVRIWDVQHRTRAGGFTVPRSVDQLAFSPDGRYLALTATDTGTHIRDAHGRKRITTLATEDTVVSVAFSPDRRLLATGQGDGQALLWSTSNWKRVGRALSGHSGLVLTVSFSPDGRTLATSSSDGTVQLWDVASHRPLGTALPGEQNKWVGATFTPDGSRLFAFYENGSAIRWEVTSIAWKQHACLVAGRDLSRQEWQQALPKRAYQTVCRT